MLIYLENTTRFVAKTEESPKVCLSYSEPTFVEATV
jgi:hypothetical protein